MPIENNSVKKELSMLDYYLESKLNPDMFLVEDNNIWASHYSKRSNLYQNHLNIPFSLLNNSEVLEFGCNSGENSLVLASAGANLTLVEPNTLVHDRLKSLFKDFGFEKQMNLSSATIDDFASDKLFDIVIAEGFLFSLPNRNELVGKMAQLLKKNGLGIVSFMDIYGGMIEFIKKTILSRICELNKIAPGSKESLEFAKILFEEDFNKLNASRKFEVWWVEMMSGPSERFPYLWSFIDLMPLLEKYKCEFYSSSPKWDESVSFNWYKNVISPSERNKKTLESWKKNLLFFLTGLNCPQLEENEKAVQETRLFVKSMSEYADFGDINSVNYPEELSMQLKKTNKEDIIKLDSQIKNLFEVLKSGDSNKIIQTYKNSPQLRNLWGSFYHYLCFRRL